MTFYFEAASYDLHILAPVFILRLLTQLKVQSLTDVTYWATSSSFLAEILLLLFQRNSLDMI